MDSYSRDCVMEINDDLIYDGYTRRGRKQMLKRMDIPVSTSHAIFTYFNSGSICSQLLRNYSGIDFLENVKPEDIEDISFIMLINRLRNVEEFKNLVFLVGYLDDMGKAPGDVLIIFRKLIQAYLREINLPEEEIFDLTDQIEGGNMNRLFEHFNGFDIQEVRRESREEGTEGKKEERCI